MDKVSSVGTGQVTWLARFGLGAGMFGTKVYVSSLMVGAEASLMRCAASEKYCLRVRTFARKYGMTTRQSWGGHVRTCEDI